LTQEALVGPLAADCAALRRTLIDNPRPPVWSLDAQEARRLNSEGNAARAADWRPRLSDLPVDAEEIRADRHHVAMRRYAPSGGAAHDPVILWLHGGGWVLGDLETADATARTACAATRAEVISVDYRCAPVDPFPAAADDALAAADWLLGSGRRVVVGGDSAGGSLAAMVAQQRGAHPGLVGQVLVYPATDPGLSSDSARHFVEGPFLSRRDMQWFYEQYLADAADFADPRIDLRAGLAGSSAAKVPAVVLTVGHDPLRDEGIEYARQLAVSGCVVTAIHAPELFHGAFSQSGVLPSAEARVGQMWSAVRAMFALPV
jgi:acetyl esterase